MTGPNDIGALRGIIGDGQSMNDEDIRTKAYGKRPGSDNRMKHIEVPKWPSEKEYIYFKKDGRSAMNIFEKFNLRGQQRQIDSTTPHVVNKILHDNYAMNKVNKVETISAPSNMTGSDKWTAPKPDAPTEKPNERVHQTIKFVPVKKENKEQQRVVVQSHTFTMPNLKFGLSKKNKKDAVNIPLGKKERLNIQTGKKGKYQFSMEAIVPTGSGLKRFAGDLADNLGKTMSSGALVGPYQNPNEAQRVKMARLSLTAYGQFLAKKYRTGDLNSAPLSPKEQYKLISLKQQLEKQQQGMTQGGFMSGAGTAGVLATSQPRMNFSKFTQNTTPQIQFSELGQGIAYPEASSRLGVQQTMASGGQLDAFNQNKWDVMLNRSSPDQRISNILGKAPDPLGKSTGESAQAKIKRLSGL